MAKTTTSKTFSVNLDHSKVLKLTAPHAEHMRYKRQTGGDVFVDYDVQLTPKTLDLERNVIHATIQVANGYELHTVEQGISNAITQFITDQGELGFGIEGFDIFIDSQLFHLVDSRPLGYKFTLYKILKEQLKIVEVE